MLRVGLTGGIGAGKSTVARRLAAHGAVLVDADVLAREVVAPGTDGLAAVVERFGPEVLGPDGSLDRPSLGRVVFSDPSARADLEAITHPRIRALTARRFADAAPDAVVVHDVPLLVELGYEDRYHLTVVVHADVEERVRRLVEERGSDEADARRRIAAQAGDGSRRRAADVWLDNTSAPAALLQDVDRLWSERLVPFESHVRDGSEAPRGTGTDLQEPDPTWEATGRRLVARVRRAVGDAAVRVDHIGSTSVPGLVAKDVIDLQLLVGDLATADRVAPRLAAAGFPVVPGSWSDTPTPGGGGASGRGGDGGGDPGRWAKRLHGSADPGRRVNLHVRAAGSPGARFALLFRDWLRGDAQARDAYAAHKRALAAEHPVRRDYAEAKEPWFHAAAGPAMERWAAATGWAEQV